MTVVITMAQIDTNVWLSEGKPHEAELESISDVGPWIEDVMHPALPGEAWDVTIEVRA